MNSTLTVIPAKSFSRRLPRKNSLHIAGKPLFIHAVEQAVASGVCGEVLIYTDSREIADVAVAAGANAPFLRSGDIDDDISVGEAACNALRRYRDELCRTFEYICLLLCTSPLRLPEDIRACRKVLLDTPALDAVGSVSYTQKHPAWSWSIDKNGKMHHMFPDLFASDRNELPKAYFYDGSVYWAKADFFDSVNGNQYAGNIAAYIMPQERAVDVDTQIEYDLCNYLITRIR